MTEANPTLDAHLDLLIHKLNWSDEIAEEARNLVIGNVRGAVGRLIEDGILVPADEIDRRVSEAVDGVQSIKAARSASEDTQRLIEAAQDLHDDLVMRAEFARETDQDPTVVDASDGVWSRFCEALPQPPETK